VLRADVVVLENAGFLLGEDYHLPGPFGKALKHAVLTLLSGNYGGGLPVLSHVIGIYADRVRGHGKHRPAKTTLPTPLAVDLPFT
jgi:hypothetical protein